MLTGSIATPDTWPLWESRSFSKRWTRCELENWRGLKHKTDWNSENFDVVWCQCSSLWSPQVWGLWDRPTTGQPATMCLGLFLTRHGELLPLMKRAGHLRTKVSRKVGIWRYLHKEKHWDAERNWITRDFSFSRETWDWMKGFGRIWALVIPIQRSQCTSDWFAKKEAAFGGCEPMEKKQWGSHWPTFKLRTVIGRPGTPASHISGFSWQFGHNIYIPTYSQLFPVQMQILVLQQCCLGIEQILSAWIDFIRQWLGNKWLTNDIKLPSALQLVPGGAWR